MTAKTGKNEVEEVEAVPAEAETEETSETEAAERPARPAAKRKRRVRVIEVIDDEDLDEVLEALNAEDEADAEADEEAEEEEEPPARPAKAAKPAAKAKPVAKAKPAAKPAVKPRPSKLEPPEEPDEKEPAAAERAATPTLFGLSTGQAVVVVVLVAALAALAIWQWRSASSLSSEKDERAAVSKVASAYGDVAFNYNAQNYQKQAEKAQKLMAGDLVEQFKGTTLPSLTSAFQSDPKVAVTSKTNQVFVGSLDGRFATAVVMVDVSLTTKDGSADQPATLLRLSLSKIEGEWKVTQQFPSGVNEQNKSQQGPLPTGVPSGGASKSPKAEDSEKPKN